MHSGHFEEFEVPSPKKRRLNSGPPVAALGPEDDDMDDLYADTPLVQSAGENKNDEHKTAVPPTSTSHANSAFSIPGLGSSESTSVAAANQVDLWTVQNMLQQEENVVDKHEDDAAEPAVAKESATTTDTFKGTSMKAAEPEETNMKTSEPEMSHELAGATHNTDTMVVDEAGPAEKSDVGQEVMTGVELQTTETAAPATNTDTETLNGTLKSMDTTGQAEDTTGPAEWEADSSPYESSSDDSSDTSDDSSDDDSDEYEMLDPEEQARRLMEDDGGSDDEGGRKGGQKGTVPRTHNEKQEEEIIEKPSIEVTSEMQIEELGKVENTVENMALIKAKTSGEYQVLEAGSLLCLESRKVIGVVAETLGRVQEPMYMVRFTNSDAMKEDGVTKDALIYYVPQHSTFVFTSALKAVKGSDASNVHDEEVNADEIEFSDDEAEAEYKRNLKLQRQAKKAGVTVEELRKPKGGKGQGRRNLHDSDMGQGNMEGISYEDGGAAEADLYTPLQRPSNLQEMMTRGGPSTEYPREKEGFSKPPGRNRSRGDRGRGDRGRGGRDRHDRRDNRDRGKPQHGNRNQPDLSLPATPKFHGLPPRPPTSAQHQQLPHQAAYSTGRGDHHQQHSYQQHSPSFQQNQFHFQAPQAHSQSYVHPQPQPPPQPQNGAYVNPQWPTPQPPSQYNSSQWQGQQQPQHHHQAAQQTQPNAYQQPQQFQAPNVGFAQTSQPFQAGAFVNPAFLAQFQQGQNQGHQGQYQGPSQSGGQR